MALVVDIVSWILMGLGAVFLVIAGIGILRLPDVFTRMHAASIGDTMGAGLILAGLMLQGGISLVTVKLIFVFILLFMTSPTATHALAKAALTGNVKPMLAEDLEDRSSKA
ncbi:MAG: monovalent cation/H(+) antiporter subunit G [Alphaproteobacteria bacterium]